MNVPRLHDVMQEAGEKVMVMERLCGRPWNYVHWERLDREDKLPLILPLLTQVERLRQAGIVHADLIPDNVMVVDKEVYLIDFGCSFSVDGTYPSPDWMIEEGEEIPSSSVRRRHPHCWRMVSHLHYHFCSCRRDKVWALSNPAQRRGSTWALTSVSSNKRHHP
jgi:serine/threonine protein kinase